jgi:hypothetical protein
LPSGCDVETLVRAAKERKFRLSAEVHCSKRDVDTLRKHCIAIRRFEAIAYIVIRR